MQAPATMSNVQAFIRRAPRMADKTSWTKPLARMTYGDSIVGRGRREAGTGDGEGRPRAGRGWREAAVAVAAEPRRLRSRGGTAERTEGRGVAAGGPPEPRAGSCGGDRSRGVPGHGRGPQDLEPTQGAVRADRAVLDVDPREPEQEPPHRLRRQSRRGRLRQERPALGERRRAPAIGEQPEIADADEAAGDDVEQEAAKELFGLELHDLHAITVGVVAPAEADAAVGEGEEPVVGDRDPVRVAPEVGEHVIRAGEGGLAVHDPGLLSQLGDPRAEGRRLSERGDPAGAMQGAAREGALQPRQIAAAEDLRQGADGEEEVGPRGNPPCPIPRQRAPGDDAVDVDVLRERLAPRVEDGGDAEVAAEMTRVAAEARERGGRGLEQESVDQPGMALGEGVEGVREGEDDVEVRNREHLAAARGEPALGGHALAFRAVTVATRVVADAFRAAGRADGAVATERRRAAVSDGAQGAALSAAQRVGVLIRRAMGADDVGQFDPAGP